jgi:hypothetical protein
MVRIAPIVCITLAALLAAAGRASAAEPSPAKPDVWSLKLGTPAAELSPDDYIDFSCGTNGGPPGRVLDSWTDFALCPADARGLHEVYFRYDDELEYWARAIDNTALIERYAGTKIGSYHVILSLLFGGDGIVDGVRIVTDPRIDSEQRQFAYGLGRQLMARYGGEGWTCVDLPRNDGEAGLAGNFLKQRCDKTLPDRDLSAWTNLYQKSGQAVLDRFTAETRQGQFESSAKLEMYLRR